MKRDFPKRAAENSWTGDLRRLSVHANILGMSKKAEPMVTVVVRMSHKEKEHFRSLAVKNGRSLSGEIRYRAMLNLDQKIGKKSKLKKDSSRTHNEYGQTAGSRVQEKDMSHLPSLLNPRSIPLSVQEAAMHDYTEWKKSNTG